VTNWPKTTQPGKVQNRGKEGSGMSDLREHFDRLDDDQAGALAG
jgi:hypothetical protein